VKVAEVECGFEQYRFKFRKVDHRDAEELQSSESICLIDTEIAPKLYEQQTGLRRPGSVTGEKSGASQLSCSRDRCIVPHDNGPPKSGAFTWYVAGSLQPQICGTVATTWGGNIPRLLFLWRTSRQLLHYPPPDGEAKMKLWTAALNRNGTIGTS
jgi:hypothetical protein